MKAFVDKNTCIGCGLCESICPKVFKMNDQGVAEAINEEVDASVVGEAQEARDQCPVEAINVEE